MEEHNRGIEKMILDGPFDSKEDAKARLNGGDFSAYHSPGVWQRAEYEFKWQNTDR